MLAVRKLGGGNSAAGDEHHVRISFFGDYVSDFIPDSLTIGDPVSEYSFDTDLGTLTSFDWEPAYEIIYDEQSGEFIKQYLPNRIWMTGTCETTGAMGAMGFTKDDTRFVVGGNYYFNIGPARAGFQITSFEVLD